MDALLDAVEHDMLRAESAILRMHDDQVRRAIFNAQVYANSGAGTYEKAVDMAVKDYASTGLNCVKFKDGKQVNIKSYAEMALRTASKRAYLSGEGTKRQEWGIHTVIINKRGNACPLCLPWVGRVLIDDVWSGGKASDGPYPLMSSAIAAGLYHPNCKDVHTTYFPELDEEPDSKFTKEELEQVKEDYKQDQKRQYAGRMVEQFDRLSKYSLDPDNKKMYAARKEQWEQSILFNGSSEKHIEELHKNDIMNLSDKELQAVTQYKSFEAYIINDVLRNANDLSNLKSEHKQLVNNLDVALSKISKFNGNLIRTVDFSDRKDEQDRIKEFVSEYVEGTIITIKQYWSTSKTEGYNDLAKIKIYIQNTKNGRDISSIGLNENEVLYERNSKFKVISKILVGEIWHILLEEAD